MKRIYQGRITKVEILGNAVSNNQWLELPDWQSVLWDHHSLFQDAVNYYTLALAAMAEGCQQDSSNEALLEWRKKVKESWLKAKRRAIAFDGPHNRLARWLAVTDTTESDAEKAFNNCASAVFNQGSSATKEARAEALVQLLEKTNESKKLNQVCVHKLPFFCSPCGQLNATPDDATAKEQERKRLEIINKIHSASLDEIVGIADELQLGLFCKKMPTEFIRDVDAQQEANRYFKVVCSDKKLKNLACLKDKFENCISELGDKLQLPKLEGKPSGFYPLAVVFKTYPVQETWEAFKNKTEQKKVNIENIMKKFSKK